MLSLKQLSYTLGAMLILSGCMQPQPKKQNDISNKPVQTASQNCQKYIKIMKFASTYIMQEFEKGYFANKDIMGAKAQLFLIKSKSQTLFAQNINEALKSYDEKYALAKKEHCDLSEFSLTPLEKIEKRLKTVQKDGAKN